MKVAYETSAAERRKDKCAGEAEAENGEGTRARQSEI